MTEDEACALVELARAAFAPHARNELETPVDTRDYGLGALPREPENG